MLEILLLEITITVVILTLGWYTTIFFTVKEKFITQIPCNTTLLENIV